MPDATVRGRVRRGRPKSPPARRWAICAAIGRVAVRCRTDSGCIAACGLGRTSLAVARGLERWPSVCSAESASCGAGDVSLGCGSQVGRNVAGAAEDAGVVRRRVLRQGAGAWATSAGAAGVVGDGGNKNGRSQDWSARLARMAGAAGVAGEAAVTASGGAVVSSSRGSAAEWQVQELRIAGVRSRGVAGVRAAGVAGVAGKAAGGLAARPACSAPAAAERQRCWASRSRSAASGRRCRHPERQASAGPSVSLRDAAASRTALLPLRSAGSHIRGQAGQRDGAALERHGDLAAAALIRLSSSQSAARSRRRCGGVSARGAA